MDIKALKLLTVLRDCGTLTATADQLHISRQAVGKMLRNIERELGVKTFERHTGKLVPTEIGRQIVADAFGIVERYDDFCREYLRPVGSAAQNEFPVSIALVNGGSQGLPTSFFERFIVSQPSIRLEVEEMSTDAVLVSIDRKEADIGIVGSHPELLSKYEICAIMRMGIWLLVPEGHLYAQADSLGLSALQGAPLVTAGRHNHLHQFVLSRCREEGIEPDIRANATESSVIIKLTRELGAMCFGFPPQTVTPPKGMIPVHLDVRDGDDFGTYALRLPIHHNRHHQRFWRYIQAYEG
ncbi:MAG: LysR family transcriptional regulator [Coriobacteriales bacterium]|nr:LysR family transcriptional regulator [Coriobacteriales bacterium]